MSKNEQYVEHGFILVCSINEHETQSRVRLGRWTQVFVQLTNHLCQQSNDSCQSVRSRANHPLTHLLLLLTALLQQLRPLLVLLYHFPSTWYLFLNYSNFARWPSFLTSNQQCQSTEGNTAPTVTSLAPFSPLHIISSNGSTLNTTLISNYPVSLSVLSSPLNLLIYI